MALPGFMYGMMKPSAGKLLIPNRWVGWELNKSEQRNISFSIL